MSPPAPSFANVSESEILDANSIGRMSGPEFELLVARLFEKMGFQVEMTKASHDGGIDIIAHCHVPLLQGKYIIQCKRYDGAVGEPFVRDLFGVMTAERANKGILVTNSSFTQSARTFAAGKPLELINGNQLHQMLAQYKIATVSQIKPSFGADQEIARLRKLVEALPSELRWRVQLAHYVLAVIESPRGISSREGLLPYVDEAEVQLSAIYEMALAHGGKPFVFLAHSCALWLGRLQLLQSKATDAVKWMTELRCDNYHDKAPIYPEILDDFYFSNAVNVANIAASCGNHELRQILLRNSTRISQFIERRKQFFSHVVGHNEHLPATVEHALAQIRRVARFHDDIDLFFRPSAIIRSLDSLAGEQFLLPYEEMRLFLIDISSISETIAPLHGIKLAESDVSLFNQGLEVERVTKPYIAWVDSWEVWR